MELNDDMARATLEMPIQAVLQHWPQAAPLFLKYRMGCIGCSMDIFDSLADALNNYAISVETFLSELSAAIEGEVTS